MSPALPPPVQLQIEAFNHYGHGRCKVCLESRVGALVLSSDTGEHKTIYESYRGPGPAYYARLKAGGWPGPLIVLCVNDAVRRYLKRQDLSGLSQTSQAVGSREQRRKYKLTVLAFVGMACQICGCTDVNVLTIDHPDHKGARHRERISRGRASTQFYAALIRNAEERVGLRTLCFSCQKVSRWENRYGPSPGQLNPECQVPLQLSPATSS
jgi:hypothetical protein